MKKLIFLISALVPMMVFGWSQKGHDVTAYIAEQHLTPQAAAAIDSILDGKSIVYWSNWLDNASHTSEYAYTKTWHYKNIDAFTDYDKMPLNKDGDVVRAIDGQIYKLKSGKLSKEESALALKILVHLMGDLHQPMHLGHLSDLGGNRIPVYFFQTATNLHAVWDGSLVNTGHSWSHSEWQREIDRATEARCAEIVAGTTDDWARETYAIAGDIYNATANDAKLSYNYIAEWTPVVEQQLLRGGLRLAYVLNDIFTEEP